MYLKSLSLYGFKTFANKLDFEFKPGTTAIIGPNGSGKSNLLDAIIWVMGETSVRSIRGRKMEEVVFHGGKVKKPLGYAQVVITFDNEDGFFPLPHSEVSIMRRYYRSGDSEFAINREPCRLRDIQALIMDTGLGKMSYSVISQGDVEYIIDLSPLQRREIFDEAAGINKYKTEKAKTLNKVRETEQNIARLHDILAEIGETLEPLYEQAEKARRYEELTEQIEKLKLSVIISDIVRLRGRMEELAESEVLGKEKIIETDKRIKEITEKLADLSRREDTGRLAVDEKMELLATIGAEVGRAEESIRRITNSQQRAEQSIQSMQDRQKSTRERITEIESELEEQEAMAAEKLGALAQAREETKKFSGEDAEAMRAKEEEFSRECSGLRVKVQDLSAEETRLQNELGFIDKQLESIEKEAGSREEEKAGVEERIDGVNQKFAAAKEEESEKTKELAAHREELALMDEQLPDLTERWNKARESFDALQDQERELKARIGALEKVVASMSVLQSVSAGGDAEEAEQPLGNRVSFEQDVARAASRALGDAMKATLLDASGIKDRPKKDGASVFLLCDWLSERDFPTLEKLKKEPGAAGLLSDFISAGETASGEVEAVFRRVLVMDNEAALMAVVPKLPAGAVAVTRDGETVFLDGVLRIGEDLVTPEAISERLEQSRADLEEIAAAAAAASETAGRLDNEHREMRKRKDETEDRISRLESALASTADRKLALAEQLGMYRAELERIVQALASIQPGRDELAESKSKAASELKKIQSEKTKEEPGLKEKEEELAALSDELRKHRASRAQVVASIETLQQEVEKLRGRTASQEMEKAQLQNRIEEAELAVEGLVRQKARLEEDVVAGRSDLAGWTGKRSEVQHELEGLRSKLSEVSEEIKELKQEDDEKREELSEAREALQQAEVKKARTETQLEEVRKHFADEFPGMVEDRAIEVAPPVAPGEKGLFKSLRIEREELMPVNQLAIGEYEEKKLRYDSLLSQIGDVEDARDTLLGMVEKYDDKSRIEFLETFGAIQEKFSETFVEVFNGGEARLVLTDDENPLEAGVEIKVQIPGQRMRSIRLLSGGQKALCALTLIFAILKVKPSPFYLLDEVDAGLDDVNIIRFKDMLKKYSTEGQFLLVTHNKGTLAGADHFYGITLEEDEGFSKVISVSLE
ncbi:chromosome segregation protein SMC [bacterium]